MPNNLASFAIHVDDVDRARRFYEAVFGWDFEPWGPPGFYLIHTGTEDDPGIQGLMHARSEPRTGTGLNGIEPTFAVEDVDAIADSRRGARREDHLCEGGDPDRGRAHPVPRPRGQRHRGDAVRHPAAHLTAQPKRYGGRPRAPTSATNRCPDHGSAADRPGV